MLRVWRQCHVHSGKSRVLYEPFDVLSKLRHVQSGNSQLFVSDQFDVLSKLLHVQSVNCLVLCLSSHVPCLRRVPSNLSRTPYRRSPVALRGRARGGTTWHRANFPPDTWRGTAETLKIPPRKLRQAPGVRSGRVDPASCLWREIYTTFTYLLLRVSKGFRKWVKIIITAKANARKKQDKCNLKK